MRNTYIYSIHIWTRKDQRLINNKIEYESAQAFF